ncbi:flippase [Dapis sp. BLCC M126]|uniref:flippase n=1 Tax=Dapis sp. BLCC M126 TaxID=3400189 RepID=UPI003CED4EBA
MRNFLARLDLSYLYAFLGELTLGLTFLLYIVLARVLGPEKYGIFASAVALAGIMSLFMQFGLPPLLNREVAANPEEGSKSTIKFLLLELLNTLPVLIILLPIAHLMGFKGEELIVCYLAIFAEFCRGIKMTQRSVLKGMGWFRTETISVAIERCAVVLCTLAVLFLTKSLVWVVTTLVVVRLLENLGLLYYLSRKVTVWSPFNFSNLIESLKIAYPFALFGVLWVIYYQIDLVMLKAIAPTGEAGFYGAAYKIMEILSALPRVIFYVAFTRFARTYAADPDRLGWQIYKATRILVSLVIPVLLVAGFLQTTLVQILYGDDYFNSIQCLGILLPNVIVASFGEFTRYILVAMEKEKSLPPILLGAVISNIAINAILIPMLGAVGAAIATLLSEFVLVMIALTVIIRIGYSQVGSTIRLIVVISLLATAMPSLILYGLKSSISICIVVTCLLGLVMLVRRDRFIENVEKPSNSED